VITTYEGTHTHVSPSTGSSRAAAADAPLLPASGEHPPGGAPYQPPNPSEPVATASLGISAKREAATTSIQEGSKPLRPTPSMSKGVEPTTFLAIPRAPLSGALLLRAQQQKNNPIKTQCNPLQEAIGNPIKALSNPLQDAMCNPSKTQSDPLVQDLQDAMCLGTSTIRAPYQQEIRKPYSKPPPSSSSSREGLLEDIVRHRR